MSWQHNRIILIENCCFLSNCIVPFVFLFSLFTFLYNVTIPQILCFIVNYFYFPFLFYVTLQQTQVGMSSSSENNTCVLVNNNRYHKVQTIIPEEDIIENHVESVENNRVDSVENNDVFPSVESFPNLEESTI